MSDLTLAWLLVLLRTTIYVVVAYCFLKIVLRILRLGSPRIGLFGWLTVLAVGWIFIRVSVWIPIDGIVFDRTNPVEVSHTAASATDVPPSNVTASEALDSSGTLDTPTPAYWPMWIAILWLGGVVVISTRWAISHRAFSRFVNSLPAADEKWQSEWHDLVRTCGIERPIPMRVCDSLGPLLCRTLSDYILVVPGAKLRLLNERQRQTIYRHEIAHYEHCDLGIDFLARILALPHWFNPFAWLALRNLNMAAEHACDDSVVSAFPDSRDDYANALLELTSVSLPNGVGCYASHKRCLSVRIRRLVSITNTGDSMMKNTVFMTTIFAMVVIAAIRFHTFAQEVDSVANFPAQSGTTKNETERDETVFDGDGDEARAIKNRSLEEAVRQFNKSNEWDLTTDEIVATINHWDRTARPVEDATYAIFEQIALTGQMPPRSAIRINRGWTRSDDSEAEVQFAHVELDVMTGEKSGYTFVVRKTLGSKRPSPSDGFYWKHGPREPQTAFANNSYAYFVDREASGRLVIVCALSRSRFHPDARLVAFDDQGKRFIMKSWGGELFDGILMKRFRVPDGTRNIELVGLEEPVGERRR